MKILLVISLILSLAASVFAGNTVKSDRGISHGEGPTVQQQEPESNPGAPISMADAAAQTASDTGQGQGLNIVMGVTFIAIGASKKSYPLIAMGMMNIAQGAMMGGASGDASGIMNGLDDCSIGLCDGGFQAGSYSSESLGKIDAARVNDALNTAKDLGLTLNPDGSVTDIKSGKTFTGASFGSDAAMSSAGLSAGDIAKVKAMTKKISKGYKPRVSGIGFKNAGGGASGSSYKFDDSDPFADLLKRMNKKKRGPAAVAGLKKKYNGDVIGVKQDDIFKMIHRRYKYKRAQKFFIED